MFAYCSNLEYINLENFEENNLISYANVFYEASDCFVLCNNDNVNESIILSQLYGKCITLDCTSDWELEAKKKVNITELCFDENNKEIFYKFEYQNKYYENCINGIVFNNATISKCNCDFEKCSSCPKEAITKDLCTKCTNDHYRKENDTTNFFEYFDCYKDPEGYYLDINIYKKCQNICDIYEIRENITKRIISTSSKGKVIYECKTNDDLNNNCNFENIDNNTEIFDIIKENLISLYLSETGKSQVIKGENNIIYQITNVKNELELLEGKFLDNQNLSIIYLPYKSLNCSSL
jgi:hypothetical protein